MPQTRQAVCALEVQLTLITWFWVQIGGNKGKSSFQRLKIAQTLHACAICSLWKIFEVLIYTKLHLK